ncbi:hypothetical protein EV204_101253 [Tissierella praeacuta]|uniref:hypothetical protein n=1 Tax=Tissierella praeacuta TaxID=43131 RepID=UPI00104DC4ED|nr:hypothetical protein [Tissierella praeacuta]TCU79274.1 hypothetical protein EV204_101253 [Tissierella praeacuta]
MKANREFLEGIYKKAEVLEREKIKKSTIYKRYVKISSMTAAIAVIVPLILFRGQISVPKDYNEIPQIVRMFTLNDPIVNFYEADYVVIGETKKINKSQYVKENNYIYTDITIGVDEIFLGDIHNDEIILRIKGGKVEKEKVFSQMEGEFKKGKKSLLFLQKEKGIYYLVNGDESQFLEIEKDIFIDKQGNKYNIDNIKDNIDRREVN